jgi:hypothetical protein
MADENLIRWRLGRMAKIFIIMIGTHPIFFEMVGLELSKI